MVGGVLINCPEPGWSNENNGDINMTLTKEDNELILKLINLELRIRSNGGKKDEETVELGRLAEKLTEELK